MQKKSFLSDPKKMKAQGIGVQLIAKLLEIGSDPNATAHSVSIGRSLSTFQVINAINGEKSPKKRGEMSGKAKGEYCQRYEEDIFCATQFSGYLDGRLIFDKNNCVVICVENKNWHALDTLLNHFLDLAGGVGEKRKLRVNGICRDGTSPFYGIIRSFETTLRIWLFERFRKTEFFEKSKKKIGVELLEKMVILGAKVFCFHPSLKKMVFAEKRRRRAPLKETVLLKERVKNWLVWVKRMEHVT